MVKKYVEWKKLDVKEDVRRVFAKRCRGGERKGQQAVVTDGRADAHEGLGVWGVQLDSQSLLWASGCSWSFLSTGMIHSREKWSGSGWTSGREVVRSVSWESRRERAKAWRSRGWAVEIERKEWKMPTQPCEGSFPSLGNWLAMSGGRKDRKE